MQTDVCHSFTKSHSLSAKLLVLAYRYATAGTEATLLLVSVALVPRALTVASDYLYPAFLRATTTAYTQVRSSLRLPGYVDLPAPTSLCWLLPAGYHVWT
jgi:hypothetical protein